MAVVINKELKEALGPELSTQLEDTLKDKNVVVELQDNFIPKTRFDEVNEQVKTYKKTASEYETKVADLTKNAKSQEELTAAIQKLTDENTTIKTNYEAQLQAREKEYAINEELRVAEPKNLKAVRALLDTEKPIKEQLEALKKSDPYLFKEVVTPPPSKGGRGTPPAPGSSEADAILRKSFGLKTETK